MTALSPTEAELRLIEIMRADSAIGAARRMRAENVVGVTNYTVKSDLHTAGDIEYGLVERWEDRKARKAAAKTEAERARPRGSGGRKV